MTDWIDDACQLEQEQRDRALRQLMNNKVTETPDQDAAGNRYCLDCGEQIPNERLSAEPERDTDDSGAGELRHLSN